MTSQPRKGFRVAREGARPRQRELEVSRIWAEGRISGDLRLVDGRRIQIIYRGVWSNSDGPDFRDAMISLDGRLAKGSIEIHIRASDWYGHGHDGDPAYSDVVLHVVIENDRSDDVLAADGRRIPTLVMQGHASDPVPAPSNPDASKILASLGVRTCLPSLGQREPEKVRAALRAAGWRRLVEKQLRFVQSLSVLTGPEVLYRGLLDALGYSANREPMARVGEVVPLQFIESRSNESGDGISVTALGLLLGTGGFLPLSPRIAELAGIGDKGQAIESIYRDVQAAYALEALPAAGWTLNRVRPANHPAARLASLASLIAASAPDGLFARLMLMPLDGGKSWETWLQSAKPSIGASRRQQIIVNVLAPFMAAYAEVTRDDEMAEHVGVLWEELPGSVTDRIARTTRQQIVGRARFPVRFALEEQGLHHIHRQGCRQLRCFDCPIAALALEHEPWDLYLSGSA